MRKTLLLTLIIIPLNVFALDKGEAKKDWEQYSGYLKKTKLENESQDDYTIPNQNACGFLGCKQVCVNSEGEEIEKEKCEAIDSFIKNLIPVKSFSAFWRDVNWPDGCSKFIQGAKKTECLETLKKKKEEYSLSLSTIDKFKEIPSNTIGDFVVSYKNAISANLDSLEKKEKEINNSEISVQELKKKAQSNECQSFRVLVSICQKSLVDANTKEATKLENKITKESGVINLSSRYQISQYRALHGTDKLPELIKNYKKLTSKDWSKELCDWDTLTNKEEKKVCGCVDDENSASSCPD